MADIVQHVERAPQHSLQGAHSGVLQRLDLNLAGLLKVGHGLQYLRLFRLDVDRLLSRRLGADQQDAQRRLDGQRRGFMLPGWMSE